MNTLHMFAATHPVMGALGIGGISFLIITVTVWDLAWRGVSLWFAARNHQRNWFIALLVLNTAGILPIIYILFFRADKQPGTTASLFNNPASESEEKAGGVAENAPA